MGHRTCSTLEADKAESIKINSYIMSLPREISPFSSKTLNASILEDKFSSPISQSWNMKRRAEAVEDSGIPYVCTGYKRSNRLRKQRLSSLSSQKILRSVLKCEQTMND